MDELVRAEDRPIQTVGVVQSQFSIDLRFRPIGVIVEKEFKQDRATDEERRTRQHQQSGNRSDGMQARMCNTCRMEIVALVANLIRRLKNEIGQPMLDLEKKHRGEYEVQDAFQPVIRR